MAISKLVKTELDKLNIPYQTIHSRKRALRKKSKNAISSETALYIVAANEGIDVHKLLPKDGKDKDLEDFKTARATYDFDNYEIKKKPPKNNSQQKENNVEKLPYDYSLSKFNIDAELVADCKIQKPYRKAVSEALLTLETRIRSTLGLPDTYTGAALITEAKKRDVFKRTVPAEEEGLYFLFMGAMKWLRNPPGHRKVEYSKEDSVKIVLFTDYLIRLFDDLVNKRI